MWSRSAILLGAVAALASCGMMGSGSAPSIQAFESAVQAFESRVDVHHNAVLAASDTDTVRRELDSYASDLGPTFREMMEACDRMMKEMMNSTAGAPEDYNLHADFMMAAIREHVSATKAAPDLASMKGLCEEHHARVQAMARHMRTMLEMMRMMNHHGS